MALLNIASPGRKWASATLLALDVLGLVVSMNIAYKPKTGVWIPFPSVPLLGLLAVTILCLYVMDVYGIDSTQSRWRVAGKTVLAIIVAGIAITGAVYVAGVLRLRDEPLFWRSVLPFGMLGFSCIAVASRLIVAHTVKETERKRQWLIVGIGERLDEFAKDFCESSIDGRACIFPLDKQSRGSIPGSSPRIEYATNNDINDLLTRNWTGIVIASDTQISEELLETLMRVRLSGTDVYDLADFYENYWLRVPIHQIKDLWFVNSDGFSLIHHEIVLNVKRLIDIWMAILILVVFAPVMLIAGFAIKVNDGGPILYRQRRTGVGRRSIEIVKFRTMRVDAEKDGVKWAARDDPRVTSVGRVLRLIRIDELPQLWNVLRGEMSCIGPRPERPEFTKQLEDEVPYYDLRYLVKPGLTGWAQVMHPYGSSVEDARRKLEYDLFYIKNHSIWLDLLIAMKTIRVMLFGRGR